MNRNELLKKANIPIDLWNKCYITEEGQIFTPDEDKTGEEVYQEWLENKNKESIKEPTAQEQINAQLLEEIAQQKLINAELMQEIATLKGGSTNV